jgi:hypothetical protein
MRSPAIYEDIDRHLVRKGELAVEFTAHDSQGFPAAPPRFARFRSFTRAVEFAAQKRAEGCTVAAWSPTGDDASRVLSF